MTPRELERNYRILEGRIQTACEHAGRDRSEVRLIAATKVQPLEVLRDLYELGLRDFGENKVQDLVARREALPGDIRWHFIGHLQSNKARHVAGFVAYVHSIDSFEQAKELSKRALVHTREIPVLIEVNISGEESKHGVETGDAGSLRLAMAEHCPGLNTIGLMGMASFEEEPRRVAPQFETLRVLRDTINRRNPSLPQLRELSMGMTNDFEVAIAEGATMIRIGNALFGERS
jgi:pyridoxal phosphate enzyme (YggS family)